MHPESNAKGKNANIPYIIGVTNDEGGEHMLRMGLQRFIEKSKAIFGDSIEQYLELADLTDDVSAARAARETHLSFAGEKVFAEMSAKAGKEPVYIYDFVRAHPERGMAYHGTCTQYLSGNYKKLLKANADDDKVAQTMQEYFCNFIKTGNPNGEGLAQWTPYTAENRAVCYLDVDTQVLPDEAAEKPLQKFAREFLAAKLIHKN